MWIMSFCATVLLLSLLFAFRDVVRGFREFFDIRLLRRHYYSLFGTKRGFWLALAMVPAALAGLAVLLIVEPKAAYGVCGMVFAGYVLLAVSSTTWLFFADALSFGRGPRRDYGNRPLHMRGNITFFPDVNRLRKGKPPVRRCGKCTELWLRKNAPPPTALTSRKMRSGNEGQKRDGSSASRCRSPWLESRL